MIPDRIYLEGFLCYRDAQEARFDGRTLWMLAGRNGSGKSAIFDAMTMVLFSRHRGGKHNARDMIHHAANRFVLELDFTVDDRPYRARRTLSRQGRTTRQLYAQHCDSAAADGSWQEVPDTHTERGFSDWIDTHIALTYESFTASVLLLQGQADNLLSAAPAQRQRLLCQMIGLDELERLERRARRGLARAEGAERALEQPVSEIPGLAETQLAQLRQDIEAAEREHAAQERRVHELTQLLEHARTWRDLTDTAQRLQRDVDHDTNLITRLMQAESQTARQQQLDMDLEALKRLAESQAQIDTRRREIRAGHRQRNVLQAKVGQLDAVLQKSRQALAAAQQEREEQLTCERQLSVRHTELSLACTAARRFAQARDALCQLRKSQQHIERQLEQLQTQRLLHDHKVPSHDEVRVAHDAAHIASEQLIRCEVLSVQLTQQLERLESVATSRTCTYCLQPLPECHVRKERHRLASELRRSQQDLDSRRRERAVAEQQYDALQRESKLQTRDRDELDRQIQQRTLERAAKGDMADQLARQCAEAYRELPATYRSQIGPDEQIDWSATRYPAAEDLAALTTARQLATRQLSETTDSLLTLRGTIDQLSREQRSVVRQQYDANKGLRQLDQRIANQQTRLALLLESHKSAQAAVPTQWRGLGAEDLLGLMHKLNGQKRQWRTALVKDDVEDINGVTERHLAASALLDLIRSQMAAVPHNARRPPEGIQRSCNKARQTIEQVRDTLQGLREEESCRRDRAKRQAEAVAGLRLAEHHRRLWRRLVRLLGRSGIQQDLLKTAERAIVAYANTILDRLTAGQLYVELNTKSTDRSKRYRALDLVARTPGSDGPAAQNLAFLSGSQKFRVAVALSLAIGQYASGVRRPVQAVIIDEGFGCLDAINRQVMIQELQNLSRHLKRILLVSHQDEFASAFADGYRCELVEGSTRLTRFHA